MTCQIDVRCRGVLPGQWVAVSGEASALGAWTPARALPLRLIADGNWSGRVPIPEASKPRFKLVILHSNSELVSVEPLKHNRRWPIEATVSGACLRMKFGKKRIEVQQAPQRGNDWFSWLFGCCVSEDCRNEVHEVDLTATLTADGNANAAKPVASTSSNHTRCRDAKEVTKPSDSRSAPQTPPSPTPPTLLPLNLPLEDPPLPPPVAAPVAAPQLPFTPPEVSLEHSVSIIESLTHTAATTARDEFLELPCPKGKGLLTPHEAEVTEIVLATKDKLPATKVQDEFLEMPCPKGEGLLTPRREWPLPADEKPVVQKDQEILFPAEDELPAQTDQDCALEPAQPTKNELPALQFEDIFAIKALPGGPEKQTAAVNLPIQSRSWHLRPSVGTWLLSRRLNVEPDTLAACCATQELQIQKAQHPWLQLPSVGTWLMHGPLPLANHEERQEEQKACVSKLEENDATFASKMLRCADGDDEWRRLTQHEIAYAGEVKQEK